MNQIADPRFAPPTAAVADVEGARAQVVLASRWRRLGGLLLDLLIFAVVSWVIDIAVFAVFSYSAANWMTQLQDLVASRDAARLMAMWSSFFLVSLVFSFGKFLLLNGYLLATRGQTVAKLILGMRIVRPDGSAASPMRTIGLRALLYGLISLVPVLGWAFWFVNPFFIFRASRRCLHDELADTIVVRI